MANVIVKFYGPAKDRAEVEQISLEIAAGETVGGVAGKLAEKYPKLGQSLGIRLAVNRTFVPLSHVVQDGDEIAVIPPVSGGAPAPRVGLTREPLVTDVVVAELKRPDAGAIATFVGTVRAELEGCKPLTALEYEAYEQMALEQMESARKRAVEKFGVLDAAIWHRLGRISLGEASILVVVVSAHRAEAFDACRWIVDKVKADAPIWKKNIWADGSTEWVDPTCT
jgi:molybdopterin synthase catalytic subunit